MFATLLFTTGAVQPPVQGAATHEDSGEVAEEDAEDGGGLAMLLAAFEITVVAAAWSILGTTDEEREELGALMVVVSGA